MKRVCPPKTERNMALVAMREKGATFSEIAEKFNITRQRAKELYDRYVKKVKG
jgi:transcriptional regulator